MGKNGSKKPISIPTAAEEAGVSTGTIYREVKLGRLAAVRIGESSQGAPDPLGIEPAELARWQRARDSTAEHRQNGDVLRKGKWRPGPQQFASAPKRPADWTPITRLVKELQEKGIRGTSQQQETALRSGTWPTLPRRFDVKDFEQPVAGKSQHADAFTYNRPTKHVQVEVGKSIIAVERIWLDPAWIEANLGINRNLVGRWCRTRDRRPCSPIGRELREDEFRRLKSLGKGRLGWRIRAAVGREIALKLELPHQAAKLLRWEDEYAAIAEEALSPPATAAPMPTAARVTLKRGRGRPDRRERDKEIRRHARDLGLEQRPGELLTMLRGDAQFIERWFPTEADKLTKGVVRGALNRTRAKRAQKS